MSYMTWGPRNPRFRPRMAMFLLITCFVLFCHQPASQHCDVCRQSKLRARPHKRFGNQASAQREVRVQEAPKAFLERICIDHLESTEEGRHGEQYALVGVDIYSGSVFTYPSRSKAQSAVETALCHFCCGKKPLVTSDRYPSLLAAIRELNMPSDPTAPHSPIHNFLLESCINVVRQGTRALLVQSGLNVEHWPRAMMCFSYQYCSNSPPSLDDGSLRHAVHDLHAQLPDGVEGPEVPLPEYESKLHMALGYQPEPRMLPFGSMVWYLGKSKGRRAPRVLPPMVNLLSTLVPKFFRVCGARTYMIWISSLPLLKYVKSSLVILSLLLVHGFSLCLGFPCCNMLFPKTSSPSLPLIHNLLPTLRTMLQLHLLSFLAIDRSRSAALRRMVLLNCAMAALGHTHTH